MKKKNAWGFAVISALIFVAILAMFWGELKPIEADGIKDETTAITETTVAEVEETTIPVVEETTEAITDETTETETDTTIIEVEETTIAETEAEVTETIAE